MACLAKNGQEEIKWFNETFFNKRWLSFSPDGKYVVVKIRENSIEIWDAKALEDHSSSYSYKEVTSISFSYDGKYMAYTNNSKSIKIQNVKKNIKIFKLKGHNAIVIYVIFSKITYFLVSLSIDNLVIFWDVLNQHPLSKIKVNETVTALDLSFDDNFIGTGLLNFNIKVWNIINPSENYFLKHNKAITCIKFSPCGNFIAGASCDRKLNLWRINKKNFVSFGKRRMKETSCLSFIPSRNCLVSAHVDGLINLWDINTQQLIMKMKTNGGIIRSIAISQCENYLVVGYFNGFIRVLNIWKGNIIKLLPYHHKSVSSVQFVNSGKLIFASASVDGTIKFWRISTEGIF